MDAAEKVRRSVKPTPQKRDKQFMAVCEGCRGAVRISNAHEYADPVVGALYYHVSCCPHPFCGYGGGIDPCQNE